MWRPPKEGGQGKGRKKTNAIAGSVGETVLCSAPGVPEGTILVGEDFSQCFTYTLSLSGVADGTVAHEVISSNFDLSGDAEDEADDGFATANDEDAATGSGNSVTAIDELDDSTGNGGTANDGQCEDPNDTGNFVDCTSVTEGDAATSGLCDDGTCDGNYVDNICDDGLCDGIALSGTCAVGDCDGIAVTGVTGDNASCTVNLARRDSAVKLNDGAIPPKQEEILNIEVASDSGTVACDIQVWVETVGNPGSVSFDVDEVKIPDCDDGTGTVADCTFDSEGDLEGGQSVVFLVYEPAKCTPLRRHTRFDTTGDGVSDTDDPFLGIICTDGDACMSAGVPISEWVEVNRGARFYDSTGALALDGSKFAAIVGGSIHLDPDGCDTDGDGVTDVDEVTGSTDPLDPLSN